MIGLPSSNVINMDQHAPDSSSFTNAPCSTILSMDYQPIDLQSAFKPTHPNLHPTDIIEKASNHSNVSDDQNKEHTTKEHAHNGTLQGSVVFDMLSAMQFNPHSPKNSIHHLSNASSSKSIHDGPLPWQSNQSNVENCLEKSCVSMKDNVHLPSAHPTGFDPITSFLKLPVLADPTKLELVDQRLLSSYTSYINNYKEDPYGGATTLGNNNNNWFNSLQLDNIRPECPLQNNDDMGDESHIVHFLDPSNEEGALQEANLVMKLDNEEASMHAQEDSVLSDRYASSSALNMFSNYHNEEQLLYVLNEGVHTQRTGQGDGMFDNMQMMMMGYDENARHNNTNEEYGVIKGIASSSANNMGAHVVPTKTGRRRGARGSIKNSEERENQRMTHIAVERNRRRQMNEHLRVLRALMPPSYIQRGDQASIIGGAIEFVRELEQLLQCLESQKRRKIMANPTPTALTPLAPTTIGYGYGSDNQLLLQHQHQQDASLAHQAHLDIQEGSLLHTSLEMHEEVAQSKSAMVDIEVKIVERSEALIKILSQRRPRQLLHTIIALQDHLHFSILHTNVTTIDNTVLYSFTVKISDDHDFSANNIASSLHELFIAIISQIPMKTL